MWYVLVVVGGGPARNRLITLLEDDFCALVDECAAIAHEVCDQVRTLIVGEVPLA